MGYVRERPDDLFSRIDAMEREIEKLWLEPAPSSFSSGDTQLVLQPDGDVVLMDSQGETVIGSSQFIGGPTGVTLTTGTEVNESWVKVAWTPGTSTNIIGSEILTSIPLIGVVRADQVAAGINEITIMPLQAGQTYGFKVRHLGITKHSDYTVEQTIVVGNDTTIPNPVTGFQMFGGFRSVYGTWNANTDYDVEKGRGEYEFEIDVVSTFNSGNQRTWRGKALIGLHINLATGVTTYYGRVRALDSSGNASAWSATLNVNTSQTTTNDLGDGTLVTNHFVAGTIAGSILTVDSLNGNRLQANTADIAVLKSGSLTTQIVTIEGTAVLRIGRTTSPFHYLLQDPNGIRAYRNGTAAFTGGELIFETNTQTGAVTIVGQLSTATSGKRVVLNPTNHLISFLSGSTSEVGSADIENRFYGTEGTDGRATSLRIRAPQNSGVRGGEIELYGHSADATVERQAIMRSTGDGTGSFILAKANKVWMGGEAALNSYFQVDGTNGTTHHKAIGVNGHSFEIAGAIRYEMKQDRFAFWEGINMNWRPVWLRDAGSVERLDYDNGAASVDLIGTQRAKLVSNNGGVLCKADASGAVEARTSTDDAFRNMLALDFLKQSDPEVKENDTPIVNPLARLRNMRGSYREYDLKPQFDGDRPALRQRKMGVMADTADPMIQSWGYMRDANGKPYPTRMVSISAEQALLGAALIELSDLVAELAPGRMPNAPKRSSRAVPKIEDIVSPDPPSETRPEQPPGRVEDPKDIDSIAKKGRSD